MKLNAEWTLDCQGKQDYDASIIRLSTRYWPVGHANWIVASATSTLYIQDFELISKDFEGTTESEVKVQVEKWAQEKFDEIVKLIKESIKHD